MLLKLAAEGVNHLPEYLVPCVPHLSYLPCLLLPRPMAIGHGGREH